MSPFCDWIAEIMSSIQDCYNERKPVSDINLPIPLEEKKKNCTNDNLLTLEHRKLILSIHQKYEL